MDPFRDDREALQARLVEMEDALEETREELDRVRVETGDDNAPKTLKKDLDAARARIRTLGQELEEERAAHEETKKQLAELKAKSTRAEFRFSTTVVALIVAVAAGIGFLYSIFPH